MNIALIGPRGVGKSKVSRKLSKLTGQSVISTDMIACYEVGGISITEFIAKTGNDWKRFRELEYQILQRLKGSIDIILDCGGGLIFDLDEQSNEILSRRKIEILHSISKVVFLNNDISYLVEKVTGDSSRPNLSTASSYENILKRRIPFYRQTSHFEINMADKKPEEAAAEIFKKIS